MFVRHITHSALVVLLLSVIGCSMPVDPNLDTYQGPPMTYQNQDSQLPQENFQYSNFMAEARKKIESGQFDIDSLRNMHPQGYNQNLDRQNDPFNYRALDGQINHVPNGFPGPVGRQYQAGSHPSEIQSTVLNHYMPGQIPNQAEILKNYAVPDPSYMNANPIHEAFSLGMPAISAENVSDGNTYESTLPENPIHEFGSVVITDGRSDEIPDNSNFEQVTDRVVSLQETEDLESDQEDPTQFYLENPAAVGTMENSVNNVYQDTGPDMNMDSDTDEEEDTNQTTADISEDTDFVTPSTTYPNSVILPSEPKDNESYFNEERVLEEEQDVFEPVYHYDGDEDKEDNNDDADEDSEDSLESLSTPIGSLDIQQATDLPFNEETTKTEEIRSYSSTKDDTIESNEDDRYQSVQTVPNEENSPESYSEGDILSEPPTRSPQHSPPHPYQDMGEDNDEKEISESNPIYEERADAVSDGTTRATSNAEMEQTTSDVSVEGQTEQPDYKEPDEVATERDDSVVPQEETVDEETTQSLDIDSFTEAEDTILSDPGWNEEESDNVEEMTVSMQEEYPFKQIDEVFEDMVEENESEGNIYQRIQGTTYDDQEQTPIPSSNHRSVFALLLLSLLVVIAVVLCTRMPSFVYTTLQMCRSAEGDSFFFSRRWGKKGYAILPMGDKSV